MPHTPGPWKAINFIQGCNAVIRSQDREVAVCFRYRQNEEPKPNAGELDANAALIAAAPELLEACEEALSYFAGVECTSEENALIDELANAIRKAKVAEPTDRELTALERIGKEK